MVVQKKDIQLHSNIFIHHNTPVAPLTNFNLRMDK